jgi:hypothetical protein
MKFKNVTVEDMNQALKAINERFDGNIAFNRFDVGTKTINATLRVISSKSGSKGRKLNQSWLISKKGFKSGSSACWHVHGYFFESLLKIAPNAEITTQYGRIDKSGGNWVDHQKGSLMEPIMYSELCECNQENKIALSFIVSPEVKPIVRTVQQSRLSAECWTVQFEGLTACDHCELRSTLDCGGKHIRVTGKNNKGFNVPI